MNPVAPIPAELPPRLAEFVDRQLPRRPRALLFDVYGTLFVSASGDIGTSSSTIVNTAVARALATASGITIGNDLAASAYRHYVEEIRATHARLRSAGFRCPEVDIVAVWSDVIGKLRKEGHFLPALDPHTVAILHEIESNPVWPMPGAADTIDRLRASGTTLGIVSNAQFYTPLLFPALLGDQIHHLGFTMEAVAFSYQSGIAKPDPMLFRAPLAHLKNAGIDSEEVLYVGNDMRNDVLCGYEAGCMTVLFAGDRRSLRIRDESGEVQGLYPDSVVRDLPSLVVLCGSQRKGYP